MGAYTPSAALQIRPQDPLAEYAKAMSVKSMVGQQQLQGQSLQEGDIELQKQQLGLKNMQATQAALSDPDLEKQFNDYQKSKDTSGSATSSPSGGPMGVTLHPLAQFLAEKKGLPFMGPGGALELSNTLTKSSQEVANLLKTQGDIQKTRLENHAKQIDDFTDKAVPVLAETDTAKQETALAKLKNDVLVNQDLYPKELVAQIPSVTDAKSLAALFNTGKVQQMLIEEGTKKAQEQTAQSEAMLKTQAAGGIRDKDGILTPQARAAMDTVKSYNAIPANMRTGLVTEMQNAPNNEMLQGIQKRADDLQASFQRSADARQQAMAMKDVGMQQVVAGKLVAEDQKLGSGLDQTAAIRGLLDMSKGGNETAMPAAQVRFAEHEIVEGGVKRMNQVELDALTKGLGDYGRQFQSWADKGFKGDMPPATNADMHAILDAEDKSLQAAHERNIGYIQNRYANQGRGAQPPTAPPSSPAAPTLPKGTGGVIDKATAQQFYEEAGRDPAKAAALARANNWKVE